jgi:glycosyltransferase 2 family protein
MNPEEPIEESPLRIWGTRVLKGVVIVLTLYLTYRFITHTEFKWSRLAHRVAAARAPYIALGTGLLLARYALWDWRFRLAARRAVGRSSGAVLGFFVLLASAALNLITPTARVLGGFMRARYFARANNRPFGFLYGVVLYDQIAHHAVMSVCTWITLIATAFALGRNGIGTAALAALVASALLLAALSRRRDSFGENPIVRFLARRAERAEGRLQSVFAHGHEAVGVFVRLLAHVTLRFQAAILGVVYFLVNAAAQWALFLAIGAPVNPLVVVAVVALGTAVGTLSGAPGGIGTTEIAMMASFKFLGVDEVLAAAGTLLYRGLHYAAVLAIGLPALALLEWRASGEGEEASSRDVAN